MPRGQHVYDICCITVTSIKTLPFFSFFYSPLILIPPLSSFPSPPSLPPHTHTLLPSPRCWLLYRGRERHFKCCWTTETDTHTGSTQTGVKPSCLYILTKVHVSASSGHISVKVGQAHVHLAIRWCIAQ